MSETIDLTPQGVVAFLRRGLVWALLAAAIAGAAMYAFTREIDPTYLARATLMASHREPSAQSFGTALLTEPPLDAGSYRTVITSQAVLAPAAGILDAIGWEDVGNLADVVAVGTEVTGATTIIRIEARVGNPRLAAVIADVVAQAAMVWDESRATRTLETTIDALTAQIDGIDTELATPLDANTREGLLQTRSDLSIQLSSARALRNAAVGRLELLESALVPVAPIAPRPLQSAITAALVAVVIVYALQLLRQVLDLRARTIDQLAALTGLPVYAAFERPKGGQHRLSREAVSYLRTNLMFDLANTHPKMILVTGHAPRQGKSSVAITLAESLAAQGYKTLLMDADLRRPVSGKVFGLEPNRTVSLDTALVSDQYEPATEVRFGDGAVLYLYPSFVPSPNPTELLSNRLRPLLDRIQHRYDVIVLDSAPLLPVADTLAMLPHVTALVMVVNLRRANRRSVMNALNRVRRVAPPVVGLVGTDVTERSGAQRHGYGYGYGYGYGDVVHGNDTPSTAPSNRLAAAGKPG